MTALAADEPAAPPSGYRGQAPERDDRLDRLEGLISGLLQHLSGKTPEPKTPEAPAVAAAAPEVTGPPEAPASPAAPAPAGAAGTADLMDLGHDAQLQGTALSLRSVANRLAVISEGLKLVPALGNIAQDVAQLNYPELSDGVDKLITFARSEDDRLMGELEKRTAARQAPTPPA